MPAVWIIIVCLIIGSLLSACIWMWSEKQRWQKLFHFFRPLYADKFWLMWQDDQQVMASSAYQRRFHSPPQSSLETMLGALSQPQYNTLIQHTNQLDSKPFHMVIEHEMQFWEVWGRNRFNCHVIEFTNVSHHIQLLQHEEIHAAISQDDSRKHKTVLDCLPVPFCLKSANQDIMFCNYTYAELFNSTCVSVIAQQLRFDNPEPPIPAERLVKVALGGKLRSFKIQTSVLPFDGSTLETIWEQTDVLTLTKDNEDQRKYFHDVCQQLATPMAIFNEYLSLEFWNKAYVGLFKFEEDFLAKKPSFADILDDLHARQKLPEPANFTVFKNKEVEAAKNLMCPIAEILHLSNGQILRHTRAPLASGIIFVYEDITDTYYLKQKNKILADVQKHTIDHLFEGVLVFGSDYCVQLFNPAVQKLFDLQIGERYHLNDFLGQTQNVIPNLPAIFGKRQAVEGGITKGRRASLNCHPREGEDPYDRAAAQWIPGCTEMTEFNDTSSKIHWAYTPLPDGSHMLRFVCLQ